MAEDGRATSPQPGAATRPPLPIKQAKKLLATVRQPLTLPMEKWARLYHITSTVLLDIALELNKQRLENEQEPVKFSFDVLDQNGGILRRRSSSGAGDDPPSPNSRRWEADGMPIPEMSPSQVAAISAVVAQAMRTSRPPPEDPEDKVNPQHAIGKFGSFAGEPGESAEDFLSKAVDAFMAYNVPFRRYVSYTTLALTKHASAWWNALKQARDSQRLDVISWPDFNAAFLKRFGDPDAPFTARVKMGTLQMKAMDLDSFNAYCAAYNRLLMHCVDMSETDKCYYFTAGLAPALRGRVAVNPATSTRYQVLEELISAARAVVSTHEVTADRNVHQRLGNGPQQKHNGGAHGRKGHGAKRPYSSNGAGGANGGKSKKQATGELVFNKDRSAKVWRSNEDLAKARADGVCSFCWTKATDHHVPWHCTAKVPGYPKK